MLLLILLKNLFWCFPQDVVNNEEMKEQEEALVERPTSPGVLLSLCRLTVENNCLLRFLTG